MNAARRHLSLVITVIASTVGMTGAASASVSACPSVNGAWTTPGPFAVTSASNGQGTTVFRPTNLGTLGCAKHPVVLWGNGGAASPSSYQGLLSHLASHGFVVAAYEGRSSDPAFLLTGLDWLTSQSQTQGTAYFGKVDVERVAATGHSLGGGQAVGAGADPRVDTVAPLMGGPFNDPAKVRGPALFIAGQNDIVVPAGVVHDRYLAAPQVPAVYAELKGVAHLLGAEGGAPRGWLTAWLRAMLLDDPQARSVYFGACTACGDPAWSRFERNALATRF